jgi:hypothetical protein
MIFYFLLLLLQKLPKIKMFLSSTFMLTTVVDVSMADNPFRMRTPFQKTHAPPGCKDQRRYHNLRKSFQRVFGPAHILRGIGQMRFHKIISSTHHAVRCARCQHTIDEDTKGAAISEN